jgi:hypothetical protein
VERVTHENDVIHELNKTTLGPYSFHVFVSASWTVLYIVSGLPWGQRHLEVVGESHMKCPRAADMKKESGGAVKRF